LLPPLVGCGRLVRMVGAQRRLIRFAD